MGRTAHPLGGRKLLLLRCRRLGFGGEGGRATLILDADRACAHLPGAARHTARGVASVGGTVDVGRVKLRVRLCE